MTCFFFCFFFLHELISSMLFVCNIHYHNNALVILVKSRYYTSPRVLNLSSWQSETVLWQRLTSRGNLDSRVPDLISKLQVIIRIICTCTDVSFPCNVNKSWIFLYFFFILLQYVMVFWGCTALADFPPHTFHRLCLLLD